MSRCVECGGPPDTGAGHDCEAPAPSLAIFEAMPATAQVAFARWVASGYADSSYMARASVADKRAIRELLAHLAAHEWRKP